jgi:hypothetical protein
MDQIRPNPQHPAGSGAPSNAVITPQRQPVWQPPPPPPPKPKHHPRYQGYEFVDPAVVDKMVEVPGGPAHRIQLLAFDDYVQASGSSASAVTSALFESLLGSFDQLAIQVVADDTAVGGTTTPLSLEAQIEHSGDGVNWQNKRATAEVAPTTIQANGATAPTTTTLPMGYDDGSTPTLALVRIRLDLGSLTGPVSAHVKVHVTCNDLHERQFAVGIAEAIRNAPHPKAPSLLSNVRVPIDFKFSPAVRAVQLSGPWYDPLLTPDQNCLNAIQHAKTREDRRQAVRRCAQIHGSALGSLLPSLHVKKPPVKL